MSCHITHPPSAFLIFPLVFIQRSTKGEQRESGKKWLRVFIAALVVACSPSPL